MNGTVKMGRSGKRDGTNRRVLDDERSPCVPRRAFENLLCVIVGGNDLGYVNCY